MEHIQCIRTHYFSHPSHETDTSIIPFYIPEHWGTERWSQLQGHMSLNGGAGIQNWAVWLHSLFVTIRRTDFALRLFINQRGQGRESGLCPLGQAWKRPNCDCSISTHLGWERLYLWRCWQKANDHRGNLKLFHLVLWTFFRPMQTLIFPTRWVLNSSIYPIFCLFF